MFSGQPTQSAMRKLPLILALGVALIAAVYPVLCFAVDIRYSLYSYGSQHAIIILTGDVRGVTVHPSSDGMSARVSGVGVRFSAPASPAATDVVTAIRPVRRGAFTELLITFATPATITASPTKGGLKIFVRVDKGRTTAIEASPGSSPDPKSSSETNLTHAFPAKITFGENDPSNSSSGEKIKIVFPETSGLASTSTLSGGLRWGAYAVDLLWSWVIAEPLQYSDPLGQSCRQSSPVTENTEVEQLVGALTKELAEVRIQLEAKEEELVKLRGTPRS